ncbi:MAG: hypothetical protein ABWY71_00570 [Candidatus Saccharimonadales bacterium]
MSGMRNNQAGFINGLLIALIACGLLLLVFVGFGAWAYGSRQDYKLNSDKKSATAAAAVKEQTQQADAIIYAEQAKNPLKTHVGPDAYGAITVQYPKTWSAYVIENGNAVPMNDYFHPDVVPDTGKTTNAYALRVQVVQSTYSQVMTQYQSLAVTKKVTVAPYKLPKVPSVVGSRVDGQITAQKQGTMIVLPLRNVTLTISTESQDFENDFNNIILPNLTFSP